MSLTTNNYDTSSTMEDCELSLFRDTMRSQEDFNENFKMIEHSGYRTTATAFYIDYGSCPEPPSYPSECYDFSKCTEKDFRAYVWDCHCKQNEWMGEHYQTYTAKGAYGNAREMVEEMLVNHGTWKEYAISVIDGESLYSYVRDDDFPDINNADLIVWTTSVTGYSQGDYANVIAWNESLWQSVDPETEERLPEAEVKSKMQDFFTHLFYDAPIYCRLEVDGKEHYFDQELEDSYEWDTDEIMKIAREKFKLSDAVLKWLENELPEYPPYDS